MAKKRVEAVSEKQAEVIAFLIGFVEENGFQPSIQEMADAFGVTKRAVLDRIQRLEAKGLLQSSGGTRERAIRLKGVRFRAEPTG